MKMKSKNTSKDKEKAEEKRRKFLKAASKLAISVGLTSSAIPFLVKGENKKNSKDEGNQNKERKKVKWGNGHRFRFMHRMWSVCCCLQS